MAKLGIRLTKDSERITKNLIKKSNLDLRPSFKVIGIGYRKEVKAIFEKKQPRDAALRWRPLSQPYATIKEKLFPGRPILVRTGALKDSMTNKGAQGNITVIQSHRAVFGSTIFYGAFHDDGTERMPRRNFSEPSERRAAIWKGQIERELKRQFRENGIRVSGGFAL